jgi:hypothetical protein
MAIHLHTSTIAISAKVIRARFESGKSTGHELQARRLHPHLEHLPIKIVDGSRENLLERVAHLRLAQVQISRDKTAKQSGPGGEFYSFLEILLFSKPNCGRRWQATPTPC